MKIKNLNNLIKYIKNKNKKKKRKTILVIKLLLSYYH